MWMPLKTNGLSRVNAPTAPNCKKGPVACREDDMLIKYTQRNKRHADLKKTATDIYRFHTHFISENETLTVPGVREEQLAILVATGD